MSNSDMSETLYPSTSVTSGKYSSTLYLNYFKLKSSKQLLQSHPLLKQVYFDNYNYCIMDSFLYSPIR